MTPKLKASCALFWFTSTVCIAFLLAMYVFSDQFFIPGNEALNSVNTIVFSICLITAAMACCGCCLIFCDVTNFACILLYVIPLAVTVPTLCAKALREIGDAELVTNESVKKFVIQDWNRSEGVPRYLAETQVHLACCGLQGPTDYLEFIYGANCISTELDLPLSCCNLTTLFQEPRHPLVSSECQQDAFEGNEINLKKCKGLFKNIFILDPLLVMKRYSVALTNSELDERDKLCLYADNVTAKVKDAYKDLIHLEGCLPHVTEHNNIVVNGNYMFLISSILITFTMLFVFLKNWIGSSEVTELNPPRSSSHLSEETLILDDAKYRPLAKKIKGI